jgi:hypothetical protein
VDPTVAVALVGVAGTVVAALAGVAGAVFGPVLAARQSAQLARNSHLADLRSTLYLKGLTYVENVKARLDYISDPMADGRSFTAAATTRGEITAEMRLLAEAEVLDAWLKLEGADVDLAYREDKDPTLRIGNLVDGNDPLVDGVLSAIADFRQAVRHVVGSDRSLDRSLPSAGTDSLSYMSD